GIDELRPQTGQAPAVREYVLAQAGAEEFLGTYHRLLSLVVEGYRREGKRYRTVAIGCTGGKARSVRWQPSYNASPHVDIPPRQGTAVDGRCRGTLRHPLAPTRTREPLGPGRSADAVRRSSAGSVGSGHP